MNQEMYIPAGVILGKLTKRYISILTEKLQHVPIERNFYPLLIIGQKSGEISQNELVALLDSDKVSVFRMVDYLEKENMIYKNTSNDDKRCQLLFISEKGKEYLNDIEKAFKEVDTLFNVISDNPVIAQQLHQLLSALEKEPGQNISLYYDRLTNNK